MAELRAEGLSATDIAKQIGRDESAVCRTLREEAVKADVDRLIAERRGVAVQVLEAAAERMVRVLLGLAEDETQPGAVRRAAASDGLDRIGIVARRGLELSGPGGAPVSVDVHALATMSPDQLRALALVHAAPGEVDSTADLPAEDADP